MSEWLAVEAIIRQRNREAMAQNMARLVSEGHASATDTPRGPEAPGPYKTAVSRARTLSNEVFEPDTSSFESGDSDTARAHSKEGGAEVGTDSRSSSSRRTSLGKPLKDSSSTGTPQGTQQWNGGVPSGEVASRLLAVRNSGAGGSEDRSSSVCSKKTSSKESSVDEMFSPACVITPDGTTEDVREACSVTTHDDSQSFAKELPSMGAASTTTPNLVALNKRSLDSGHHSLESSDGPRVSAVSDEIVTDDASPGFCDDDLGDDATIADVSREDCKDQLAVEDVVSLESRSSCISPSSSHGGGVYSTELLEEFGLNLHRIDNDVQRCDRNYCYFTPHNLEKLRNVMCTYVWEHLSTGYLQGMCDLVAPLLVVFDDEALTYSCFRQLMVRMTANFPHGGQMDQHFANMRSLIQILDSEMFELMQSKGDYSHFYFCYRWFLLDFKRELVYDDVFVAWETIWAARHVSSSHFFLFIALALVEHYRDIILDNNMDFTDIIKFFNEMAERHDAKVILRTARSLVTQLQTLIENK
ncbi:hypothetical protein HAZT_HAZT005627 [Hyalella azteca]|uniref:Rab-GAP TBC domain-containing protein n=1 Tax=Hyalella azteca TaxID=294128 RepID=A0A6A0GU14_HYAAZ|nr:hypothetical protein HAZT_HAZT005627 [Hyalella azteca]